MIPAISMAYEKKEADIMKQPPRNPKTERLVTKSLVSFSYLLVGIFQMLAGMFTYFVVYLFAGFELKQVINLDRNDQFLNCDVADKYLTCSTAKDFSGNYCIYSANPLATRLAKYTVFNMDCNQREIVSDTANASYVLSIIIVQVADVMISKTRRNSVFLQGMGNLIMNIGIAIEFLAISFLIYTPKVNRALSFNNVSVLFWVPPLPFFMGIFGLDEMRKLLIRKDFNGWVKRNTYW
ncbi:hypothetical protein MHBO_002192 [Bonamia ostreae]|uniref:Cation-transporting P-type ATPase C-terminal domain-containing protein n=1 Tax=Bonamia ostreae TaxID=126728 RepID=A0ABV2AM05_9EUKA